MPADREVTVRVPPALLHDHTEHRRYIAEILGVTPERVPPHQLIRRSLDARGRAPMYHLRFRIGGEPAFAPGTTLRLCDVSQSEPVIVVGLGPAGLFAAFRLIELGLKPIVLERGKPVRERRFDLAAITKRGEVNPDSNYCFGEGGAGTFSDGKLYTRSHKRGSIERILRVLVDHGAAPDILIDAHPHIGTNKLPGVVSAMREAIISAGGEIRFSAPVADLLRAGSELRGVRLRDGTPVEARAVLLATGHSARDVYEMLHRLKLAIEQKPFALGVRVEHPQQLVDTFQYRSPERPDGVPPASYSLVAQSFGRGVFSFCMCPGGIICPAATTNDEVVVNGWSPSRRNSPYANSGIVVEVREEDLPLGFGAMAGVELQRVIERRACLAGGGRQAAPAQRLTDLLAGRASPNLPECSYLPGLHSADLRDVLPEAIHLRLLDGLKAFERKRPGYLTDEAVAVAVESRTSSPVRIPRDASTRCHPGLPGLFPVGEGAGYAGGIVSAAMDGESSATAAARFCGIEVPPDFDVAG